MSNLTRYDPNKNPAGRNLVVSAIKDIVSASGIAPLAESVWTSFTGVIQWLENTANDFLGKQVEKHRIRANFNSITVALNQGGDSVSRQCYSFCQRVHQITDTDRRYIFMSAVHSKFQTNMPEAMRFFSQLENELVNKYFNTVFR